MKAMKSILITIALLGCSTMLKATEFQLYETSSATYKTPAHASMVGTKARGGIYSRTGSQVCPTSMASTTISFHSTSAMTGSGSCLPIAAVSGVTSAEEYINGGKGHNPSGPKRVGPSRPPADPFDDPLTDAVPCLLLLAIGYAIYLGRKTSVPNRDSRK